MSKVGRLSILFSLILVGLTFIIAFLLERNVLPNQLLFGQFEADLARVNFIFGLILAVVIALLGSVLFWWNRRWEEIRQEEQAVHDERHRRFLKGIDHEVKNPVQIIGLGVANLQHGVNLSDEQVLSVNRMHSQVERLKKLIQDLRWLGELETRELDQDPVDTSAILEESKWLACEASESENKDIELNIQQVPWPLAQTQGDRDLLVLAFRNLFDNAIKFTAEQGQIVVRASDDGNVVVVEVADNGVGIPEKDVPHVFEELYRGENAIATAGSGMGLALVERIISLHKGKLDIRSRVGQGTVVRIRLPVASSARDIS